MSSKSNPAIWAKACKHLERVLSKDIYDRWIALIEEKESTSDKIVLSVANDFYQDWLRENYLPLIKDAVTSVCGKEMEIEFCVNASAAKEGTEAQARTTAKEHHHSKSSSDKSRKSSPPPQPVLNTKYTFDTFVVGPSNSFAHAASLAVAQSPAKAYNPLFIYGGVGLGKTHLMQAIGNLITSKSRLCAVYTSSEAFTNEYIDALQQRSVVKFRKKYRCVDILMIDDIHFLTGKERMQEEFFHTFNALFDNHKQIVLTCDRPASEIPALEQRLISRFEWGLVTELEVPDVETRIAILKKKQEELNLKLSYEALTYIAKHVRSNIRRLEGALIRAASFAALTNKDLTVESLDHLLRDTLDQEKQEALSVESVQRIVADYYDIRFSDMTSKRRPQEVAFPRQVAMYLCRTNTSFSLPSIGNSFGRNHATVIHACRLVEDKMKGDADFRRTIAILSQKLSHPHNRTLDQRATLRC